MTDVNEEIAEQYLKIVKHWFYVGDISFQVPRNYSNIDILTYDPKRKKYYDLEVKFRSAASVTNCNADALWLADQFQKYKNEREKKIGEYTHGKKSVKVLVTTFKMMGKSKEKRRQMEERFRKTMKKLGFDSEVWYFDEMIPSLVKHVETSGRYNTQLLQTIRMLKIYKAT
jgi:hypothetical protein